MQISTAPASDRFDFPKLFNNVHFITFRKLVTKINVANVKK